MTTTTSTTIEIIVDISGDATIETKGFTGPACRVASQFLEQALGERTDERLTAAFHQPCPAQQTQQQRT